MKTVMVALCMALAGGMAVAQSEAPRRGGMGLMRADTNNDGVVTRAEYIAQVDARFARMDANGNGKLDADEISRGPGPRNDGPRNDGPPGGGPAKNAPHGDAPPSPPAGATPPPAAPLTAGTTRDQFRSMAMTRFDRMDANHDGKLDASEMPARPGRGPDGDRRGPPPPPPAG